MVSMDLISTPAKVLTIKCFIAANISSIVT